MFVRVNICLPRRTSVRFTEHLFVKVLCKLCGNTNICSGMKS